MLRQLMSMPGQRDPDEVRPRRETTLLAIDVGNTNTTLGVYRGERLVADWRIETNERRTADEYAVLLRQLCAGAGLEAAEIGHGIVASVVPPALRALEGLCRRLGAELMVVGPGIRTGMPILYESPREVGADRIVNAVAAFERLASGCIVVDFGTATTWDLVSAKGEYLGGVIAPGIGISAEALYTHASKLPRVDVCRPSRVIGRNTEASMQAGLYYGYAAMVDGVVKAIRREIDFEARCIATGGLAALIAEQARTIEDTDELLTLRGLKVLFDRNT
jgi:type III pantothenate kinase